MFEFFKKKNKSEIITVDTQPIKEKKAEKASRGIIEESSVYGIGYGENYVDRVFKLAGLTNDKLWQCYTNNSWIRACIDKIIKEVCKYKLVVKAKDNVENKDDADLKKRIKEVQDLLDNPNPKVESFDAIRRKYLRDILVYDAGALEIVKGGSNTKALRMKLKKKVKEVITLTIKNKEEKNKETEKKITKLRIEVDCLKKMINRVKQEEDRNKAKPKELYDISGCDIVLNVDKHGNFKEKSAYKLLYERNVVAEFKIDELIYFMANPIAGSAYGISPIESIYNTILADNQAAILNRRRLESDGLITGVLSFPGMSEQKLKRNAMFWKAQARTKGGSVVVTSNKDVTFTRVTESPEEMQFMEYQKWILNKIMAVYGMQPIVLGVIDSTTGKLNSDEQRRQFKSDAVIPLLKLESHHLTDVLVSQGFGYKDIKVDYEEPKQEIDLAKMSEIVERIAKLNGVIRKNEARELIGLPPLAEDEGGEELIVVGTSGNTNIRVNPGEESLTMLSQIDKIRERIDSLFIFEDEENEQEVSATERAELQLLGKKIKLVDKLLGGR